MESAALDQKQLLNLKSEFEFVPEEIPKMPGTLEYSSDPARRNYFNKEELIEHVISIEQSERNEDESYSESKWVSQNLDRFM